MKDLFFESKIKEYGISPVPENAEVAMAYVPYQNSRQIYDIEQGFCAGTLFPELDKPFCDCNFEGDEKND
ncbi:MAG: spore coat associated protein CotJA [Candidatus Paraimprobicoccus trichonymphae]|uniref:Spore coat associated protein CotJA n=1 Tax=Candidatus Paraimprobicoccus trichonymphae TaxID=3033793 RepID=A0AA48L028_9FIRM|nr:MAG: spore coat associated protein CotJA [Candidatus Paraimprobicoccus trichonymphae]